MQNSKNHLCSALAVSLCAGALTLTPQTAKATPTVLVSAGQTILKTALKVGLEAALGEFLGTGSDAVSLSEESFAQIEEIMSSVINTYAFNDYQADIETAMQEADNYYCDKDILTGANLEGCIVRLDDAEDAAIAAANGMATIGLQGGASYAFIAAMEVAIYHEHRDVLGLEVDGATYDSLGYETYTDNITDIAVDHAAQLEELKADWDALFECVHSIYYDIDGELKHNAPGDSYFYYFMSEAECQEESAAYMLSIEDTRDDVLGADFDELLDEMMFTSTGMWTTGKTSTELFCDTYDNEEVWLSQSFSVLAARGAMHRVASRRNVRRGREAKTPLYRAYCKFWRQSPRRRGQARRREALHPGLLSYIGGSYFSMGPQPQSSHFEVECGKVGGEQIVRLKNYQGSYLRARNAANDYVIDSIWNTANSNAWTVWLQDDGTWAFRNKKQGRYLTLGTAWDLSAVTQQKSVGSGSKLTVELAP
ncbi:hypothetical protein ENSA5_40360 [Enhygromyxa salina]|uniref:Uncharacterized protein n=1 Tax=Enhygromyxa salina TaxID=215803 RepID=A0A2S9XQ99_9BACT|nr:hypothetical protein [Enhygromyxa salina]PRP95038.1 hypothetical protein ENSA5_40360 [Enhygromyxa salina]